MNHVLPGGRALQAPGAVAEIGFIPVARLRLGTPHAVIRRMLAAVGVIASALWGTHLVFAYLCFGDRSGVRSGK